MSCEEFTRKVQLSKTKVSLPPRPKVPVLSLASGQVPVYGQGAQICNICLTRKATVRSPRERALQASVLQRSCSRYPLQNHSGGHRGCGCDQAVYPERLLSRSSVHTDDISALCESSLSSVFGTTAITTLAKKIGRNVVCSEKRKPLNLLRILCESLRQRKTSGKLPKADQPLCQDCHHSNTLEHGCLCEDKCRLDLSSSYFPRSAFDLLARLLDVDPDTRISAEDALQHPFITET
ncbi:uncharacterized protein LOC124361358 [Homalodisca vitripennis]|uniref:uncharacterized protein LOC124361358 n=1 Tax=Homalodisca vitripennis TaxID=197043 RepID=UPI001EEB64F8|nr:uncharacterized protein LOC124361358 [Homalodisca vitripennis]